GPEPVAGGGAQSCGGRGHARRPGVGPGTGGRAAGPRRAARLPPEPRRPCRSAAAAGTHHRGPRSLPRGAAAGATGTGATLSAAAAGRVGVNLGGGFDGYRGEPRRRDECRRQPASKAEKLSPEVGAPTKSSAVVA